MKKPEEIRARALMPSNSDACWIGAPFSYYWTPTQTSKLLWTTKGAHKHSHIKILVGGNKIC